MEKIISFGKVDYYGNGKKSCEITIEIELREKEEGKKELSICGNIWNFKKTDILCGGQCLDEIKKYLKGNKKFNELHRFWKLYHLNGMNAGTIEQDEEIERFLKDNNIRYDYTIICEHLKSVNLYEVEHEGKPYKYGHSWLYRSIPENDLKRIIEIIKE